MTQIAYSGSFWSQFPVSRDLFIVLTAGEVTAVTNSCQSYSKLYVLKNNYVPNPPVELSQLTNISQGLAGLHQNTIYDVIQSGPMTHICTSELGYWLRSFDRLVSTDPLPRSNQSNWQLNIFVEDLCDSFVSSCDWSDQRPLLLTEMNFRAWIGNSTHPKQQHDNVIKWKHFLRYWPFSRRIHRSPVNSPHKRPLTRSFDVFFDLRLKKRLSKRSWRWWFEMQSRPLWRHCNECVIFLHAKPWIPGGGKSIFTVVIH